MVQEGSFPSETEGTERTDAPGSNQFYAKSIRCSWYKGTPWDPKAPLCITDNLDELIYQYKVSKRKGYRPDIEFLNSGIPEYIEWIVTKFILQYDNIETLKKYKEFNELNRGLKLTDSRYLSTSYILKNGLENYKDLLPDIKLQSYLIYIILLRKYKLIWRPSTETYNSFTIYYRHSVFLRLGQWIRSKSRHLINERNMNNIALVEDIDFPEELPQYPLLTQLDIARICNVSTRQLRKLFSSPKYNGKQKLVDMKYLKDKETNLNGRNTN